MAHTTSIAALSTSITRAINFLTRPLICTIHDSKLPALRLVLDGAFQAYLQSCTGKHFVIPFRASLPPRFVLAAGIASDIEWSEWYQLLGGRDFDLVMGSYYLRVTYRTPKVVQAQPPTVSMASIPRFYVGEAQVPISKLGQQQKTGGSFTQRNTTHRPTPERTLAQDLLMADAQEEKELFFMISKLRMTSPSPTRESFFPLECNPTPAVWPISIPEVIIPDSRPSSRSSSINSFSDNESLTSASSSTSFSDLSLPSASFSTLPAARPNGSSLFDRSTTPTLDETSQVFVDNSKKDKTKYMYQGGISTVLTGGVMLGGPSRSPPTPKANHSARQNAYPTVPTPGPSPPRYRAPFRRNQQTNGTWRRTPTAF